MYGQQAQPQVQPHHLAAVQYLPANFPQFFSGLNHSLLYNNGVNDIPLAEFIQKSLIRYIITSFNPSVKPTVIMYNVLSSDNFNNQEFLKVSTMAFKVIVKLIQSGRPHDVAITEGYMNASARWVVDYLRANGGFFQLTEADYHVVNKIDNSVKQFEARLSGTAQQPQQHNQQYPGSVSQHINQQYNQPVTNLNTAISNLYSQPANTPVTPVGEVPLNSGTLLSTLGMYDAPPVNKPLQSNETKQYQQTSDTIPFTPFVAPIHYDIPEQKVEVIQEPVTRNYSHVVSEISLADNGTLKTSVKEVEKPIDKPKTPEENTVTVINGQFPEVKSLVGSNEVDFEKHDLKRLLRNMTAGVSNGFDGLGVMGVLASADINVVPLKSNKAYTAEEGEASENVDVGTNDLKTIVFSNQQNAVASDYDIRVILASELNHITRAVVTTVAKAEIAVDEEYQQILMDLFSSADSHVKIAEIINTVISTNSDLTLVEIVRVIDKRLCDMVVEIMNIELGLKGSMTNYRDSIVGVLNYLAESVNEISYDHLTDATEALLAKALSGITYGVLEDVAVVCLTRCTSDQFPYIVGDSSNATIDLDGHVARVNPNVTPALHKGLSRIFDYVDEIEVKNIIRKVYLMTFDGAKISLYRSPFTDSILVFKETA